MIWHTFQPGVALVGLVVGAFVGISGVGGGSLMTPLLILFLGVHPAIAIGTDLVYSVPTKIVGALTHRRAGTIDGRLVKTLSFGGVPGAALGAVAVGFLRGHVPLTAFNAALRHAVGIALLVAAAFLLVRLFMGQSEERATGKLVEPWNGKYPARFIAVGAAVGFCVSVTSIGSGAMTLPLLFALLPALSLRRLVGSDVAFAAFLLPVAALGAFFIGNVNVPLALNLIVGSIPGVIAGSYLCRTLPERFLRPGVAAVLVFAGTRLM